MFLEFLSLKIFDRCTYISLLLEHLKLKLIKIWIFFKFTDTFNKDFKIPSYSFTTQSSYFLLIHYFLKPFNLLHLHCIPVYDWLVKCLLKARTWILHVFFSISNDLLGDVLPLFCLFLIATLSFHLYLESQEILPQFFSVRGSRGAYYPHVAYHFLSQLVACEPG